MDSEDARPSATPADPEGGAHGCAPTSAESRHDCIRLHRYSTRRRALRARAWRSLVAEALSLVTFFVPAKKVTRRKAAAFDSSKTKTPRQGSQCAGMTPDSSVSSSLHSSFETSLRLPSAAPAVRRQTRISFRDAR